MGDVGQATVENTAIVGPEPINLEDVLGKPVWN
jgi:hypothetical protein